MHIGFWLSNQGGSPLVIGLERGLQQIGHGVALFHPKEKYDLVLMFNQVAHTTGYAYPEFPRCSRIVFVDCAEYGYFKRLPAVAAQYQNAFSPGSMNHDTKNLHEQTRLRQFLEGKSFPYFIREYLKFLSWPSCYHPIDYPMYLHSECNIPPNREEYLARQLDLFVYWGGSHPWRMNITQALRDAHTKCEITVIGENGAPRMSQDEYFRRTRLAKASVSFDGYGSSSFRLTEVLTRCLLLVGPMAMYRHAHLVDGIHAVEYQIETDGENFIGTNIGAKLREFLAEPERCFRIYEAGYHHCWGYYTERATAAYLMKLVEQHNWGQATPLNLT